MKAQSSLEFLSMISLSMIILASLTALMASKQQDTLNYQAEQNAKFISEKTSFQVEMALVQGEGYSRIFTLPGTINGKNYTVGVGNGGVEVDWESGNYYKISRYQGENLILNVNSDSQVFKVLNNRSGVYLTDTS